MALARGIPTPEQEAAIEAEMQAIVPPDDALASRLVYIRHAAEQAADPETVIRHLVPLLREKLSPTERADLERMLETIAVIHQGPIPTQQTLIAKITRGLMEPV